MSQGGRRTRLLAAIASFATVATAFIVVPTLTASPSNTRASGTCPYATHNELLAAEANPSTLKWMTTAYQSARPATVLAQEVLSCEQLAQPVFAKRFPALLALISLNNTPNNSYENINMNLKDSLGALTYYPDFHSLGVPSLTLEDGPGGIIHRSPTGHPQPVIYPNELALAASFDPNLALSYGQELGLEAKTLGYMGVQAPDLNLDRVPNWGRSPETFGEDPVLAGIMGTAETVGILQRDSFVVLKHFGVYGQETSRKSTNNLVGIQALHDTYLRPFAITMQGVAASSIAPTTGQIAVMCSYGDLNSSRSCTNPELTKTLRGLPYSGLVRSDLDTVTTATDLLSGSVDLIKPLISNEFAPFTRISTRVQTEVNTAALNLLTTLFEAKLVNPQTWVHSMTLGSFTAALHQSGVILSNQIIQRGAVLLKNSTSAGSSSPGSLPISPGEGPITIVAPSGMGGTCSHLASWLSAHVTTTKCAIWNKTPVATTTLMSGLALATTKTLSKTVTWVAPSSGSFLVTTTTFGSSWLSMNGVQLQNQPGIGTFYAANGSTIQVTKGAKYHFTMNWQKVGPTLSIAPLAPSIAAATAAVKGAKMAIALGYDSAAEGEDRYTLQLPYGQDAIIASVAATVPTAVVLATTGPVTMPWVNSARSVLEVWNPVGYVPIDTVINNYVPAYGQLLSGVVSPSGHLPITFPASQSLSPLNVGAAHYGFWPGLNGAANLTLSPLSGIEIGYGWYQTAKWPVLFPFGWGLTYGTMTNSFDVKTSCTGGASTICLNVNVHFSDVGRPARDAVQVYVAQPSLGGTRPPLILGTETTIDCREAAPTGRCAAGVDTPVMIASNMIGPWNAAAGQYRLSQGCYTFVVSNDARSAYSNLANPASDPGGVVNATFNGTSWSSVKSGKC